MTQNEILLPAREVCLALGISRSTLDRQVKAGTLPSPVRFGRTVRWRPADIAELSTPKPQPTARVRTRRRIET